MLGRCHIPLMQSTQWPKCALPFLQASPKAQTEFNNTWWFQSLTWHNNLHLCSLQTIETYNQFRKFYTSDKSVYCYFCIPGMAVPLNPQFMLLSVMNRAEGLIHLNHIIVRAANDQVVLFQV